LTPFLLK